MHRWFPGIGRRGLLLGSSALALAPERSSLAASAAQTLVVGVQGLPDQLPTSVESFAAENIIMQTMTPLVLRDDLGNLLPGLAIKWTALDTSTWRFDLRAGVTFHDGAPFTASDVKFTLDYILAPNSLYGLKSRISQISGTDIVDDHTVIIHTKGAFPTLINGLSDIPIEPQHYIAKVGRAGMDKRPLGTGPFKFDSWVPGDRFEASAYDGYWGGRPLISKLVMRQIPEGSTRVAALLAGRRKS